MVGGCHLSQHNCGQGSVPEALMTSQCRESALASSCRSWVDVGSRDRDACQRRRCNRQSANSRPDTTVNHFSAKLLVCSAALVLLCLPVSCGEDATPDLSIIPSEFLDDFTKAYPAMRKLLQENVTEIPNTINHGTSYSCVSQHEYRAIALDKSLSIESRQYTDGTFFCENLVDYAAVCDMTDPEQSCNNKFASDMYDNFERALRVYSCKQYSRIWTCQNCLMAYKRWLCSQVYRKFILPDTDYVETGVARQDSPVCACTGKLPIDNRDCIRVCNGMPTGCIVDISVVSPQCWQPTCGGGEGGVGTDLAPGLCTGYIFLDKKYASAMNDFYVGAKVEMLSGGMAGWWATIEHYSGFARVAMFTQWVPPKSKETEQALGPKMDDSYIIHLTEAQRGHCRNFSNPLKRLGPPCEQSPVYVVGQAEPTGNPPVPTINVSGVNFCPDSSDFDAATCGRPGGFDTPAIPYQYPMPGLLGGTRCEDHQKCIQIPKRDAANPFASPTGYACCEKSGYEIVPLLGEFHKVYTLMDTNTDVVNTGFLNYTCVIQEGNNYEITLLEAPKKPVSSAHFSEPMVEASGCQRNFTSIAEKAFDDCVLKTCATVCYDVVRRCPVHIKFNCPERRDNREYDVTLCNMAVPHGCMMQVQAGVASQSCVHLNPKGLGPDDSQEGATFLTGSQIFGLPEEPTCYGLNGISINAGDTNPPMPPQDVYKANNSREYDIWCPNAEDATLRVRGEDENCRQIRYQGAYIEECQPPT